MFSKIWMWHALFLDCQYRKGMQMTKQLPPGVCVPLQNCLPEWKQLVLIYSLMHMQISLKSHTQMILHWDLEHLRRSIVYYRKVVSGDGSISSAVSLCFWSWIMVGVSVLASFGIRLSLNSLHKLLFINHIRKSLYNSISTAVLCHDSCLLFPSNCTTDHHIYVFTPNQQLCFLVSTMLILVIFEEALNMKQS